MLKYVLIILQFCILNFLNAQNTKLIAGKTIGSLQHHSANSIACDTVYSFPVSLAPGGLTFDGTGFWLSDGLNDSILKYDVVGQIIRSIPSPVQHSTSGGDLDFDG